MADETASSSDLLNLTTQIVVAQLGRAPVAAEALPELIRTVHNALSNAHTVTPVKPTPAVPPARSVFPDHIICLEDGRKLTMLKRHLRTAFGMTPAQYREKWGLPASYPMVAPSYANRRSALAKKIGLGRKSADAAPSAAAAKAKAGPKGRPGRKPGKASAKR